MYSCLAIEGRLGAIITSHMTHFLSPGMLKKHRLDIRCYGVHVCFSSLKFHFHKCRECGSDKQLCDEIIKAEVHLKYIYI